MRYFSASIIAIILLFSQGCGPGNNSQAEGSEYTGIIEASGITSYQYGTHTLRTENDFYALKSDSIDLSIYEGERVTVQANTINGYPVDGGPVYLNVTEVRD
ncbi:hypothetical protein MKO06_04400 [Gramella sp. GC03-9]|uniref:Uncharacterized protein n=1 Tax=Christiangramia oceanisediminis TaxID=2920386 RepID=A0A9X2I1D0_9FLAO|nr:hypothetical protein [Gramella oceanisediminis]MCP9199136.1 hypothetical protein [Gramella oceanisediminis]